MFRVAQTQAGRDRDGGAPGLVAVRCEVPVSWRVARPLVSLAGPLAVAAPPRHGPRELRVCAPVRGYTRLAHRRPLAAGQEAQGTGTCHMYSIPTQKSEQ